MKKFIWILLFSATVWAQTPSVTIGGGVKVGGSASGSYLNTSAFTRAGVVALWTSCTSGYLKFDGTCSTPASGGGVTDHSLLTNLDYASSGHTGFQAALAGAQLTALGNLSGVNTGDETTATIKTKLGITTLSGSNTGDQDLSTYYTTAAATTALAGKASSTASTTVNGTTCTLGSTCTVTASVGAQPFMVGNSYTGLPATGYEYFRGIIADTSGTAYGAATTITLPANCLGTKFNGNVNASTGATVLIKKNGSTICTGTVSAGGQNATFTGAGGAFTSGDVLSIVGGTADPTWANPVWAIAGSR